MREGGHCGIAKAEPTHDHVPIAAFQFAQAEIRDRVLDGMKQARHQKRLSQLHLEDFQVSQHGHPLAPQTEFAERCVLVIQLLKRSAHPTRLGRI
jgi:hypothetical protein